MKDSERKRLSAQRRDKRLKFLEKQNSEISKRMKDLENISKQYPPMILTLLKRLKRIDPFTTVAAMEPIDCAVISFYKLRQVLKLGSEDLRIAVNPAHVWTEFKYDDKWWIFDPTAVKNLDLGHPVKQKNHASKTEYLELTRYYYDIKVFFEKFGNKLSYTVDEAKITAMEDQGLSSAIKLKYH